MPLTEAQPDALAEVYARSLMELAESKGGREAIETSQGEMEDILELARGDAAFSEFLASRVLPVKHRSASLERILKGRVSDLTLRFLQTLNAKGRLSHLPAIAAAYDRMAQDKFGRVEVNVYTASPISPEDLRTIRDRIQQKLGREAIMHPYTDEAMIGGIKFQIGDTLIDGSVATHLRQVREQLMSRGAARFRANFDRMIDDLGS
jgi:F-type H+-transporting ATPase subunit delta